MVDVTPHPKPAKRKGGRRFRAVASPKQWAAIRAAKGDKCRLNEEWGMDSSTALYPAPIEYHHLVARGRGGDDVEDNIVPLCRNCHEAVTRNKPRQLQALARSLTDAEYAYCVAKLGEGAIGRLFGV